MALIELKASEEQEGSAGIEGLEVKAVSENSQFRRYEVIVQAMICVASVAIANRYAFVSVSSCCVKM